MANKMEWWDWLAIVLLVAGGLNWGLVTWFGFDLVTFISFGFSWIEILVKSLVGISGVYGLWFIGKQLT